MKKLINTDKLPVILTVTSLIILWEMIVQIGIVDPFTLPAPSRVIFALFSDYKNLLRHLLVTLQEAGLGFVLAIVIAFLLSMMMDFFPIVKKAIYPLLIVSQTVPIIVLAPLFGMWFGFGIMPKIIIVILVCFFPIVINLTDGLDAVDEELIHLVHSMGAGPLKTFRFIKFPYALQSMFSGIRIAATYAIMGAVIGEWLGGSHGIGVYMLRVRHSFQLDKMFAAILLIVLLSVSLFKLIDLLQVVFMPWSTIEEE
jgi:ABC-type nitrate/sulfonate/bicarbonate transport system permease component